jgi:hypothetical protein
MVASFVADTDGWVWEQLVSAALLVRGAD